ncbi:HAD-IIB family hydrolase [Mesorhizobium sp. 1B3]|uniref:HAD-IIB family hydrolase n=1 Tax=Mesorhizobium sp. 1B3 TaxID=3243599 RepID=UPI003D99A7B5
MHPLRAFPAEERSAVTCVLTDIDDTLTTEGLLPSTSLAAMEELVMAGLHVVPVTGRPAGWCDHIARMWPVDAVIGENGAFWFSYDREARRMRSGFAKPAPERRADRARLNRLRETILAEVPGAGVASDQDYRVADLAIDFREDVEPLGKEAVGRIVSLFEEAGATAKVSSIHVNGWFGHYDKLSMTRQCLATVFGFDIDDPSTADRIVFVGDSPNDQPMFAFFRNAVGVANVAEFALETPPRWVTRRKGAAGFRELADSLLEHRAERQTPAFGKSDARTDEARR